MFQFINQFFHTQENVYDNAYEAAGQGDLNATKSLLNGQHELDTHLKDNLYSAALYGGNTKVYEYVDYWIRYNIRNSDGIPNKGFECNEDDYIMNNAILQLVKTENTEMISYVRDRYICSVDGRNIAERFMKKVCEYAVQESKVKILELIDRFDMSFIRNDPHFNENEVLFQAIRNDDIEMMTYWMNNNIRLFKDLSDFEYDSFLDNSLTYAITIHKKQAIYCLEHYIKLHNKGIGARGRWINGMKSLNIYDEPDKDNFIVTRLVLAA